MNNKQVFTDMSAALTGIAESVLAPDVTNFDLVSFYFNAMSEKYGDSFIAMLDKFNTLISSGATPDDAVKTIIEQTEFSDQACQLNFLWYMGGFAVVTDFGTQTRNLSTISYQKGMVWQVMQSHPMGYSVSRYGYWGHEPAPLKDYIGDGE